MKYCNACEKWKEDKEFLGEYLVSNKTVCDDCFEFPDETLLACAKCGERGFPDEDEVATVQVFCGYEEDEDGGDCEIVAESNTAYCSDCFEEAYEYAKDYGVDALDSKSW